MYSKEYIFAKKVIEVYPEIAETKKINRKQIDFVRNTYNLPYPTWITNNPANKLNERAHFKFDIEMNTTIDNSDINNPIPIPVVLETDEEIALRIQERYESMQMLIEAVADNVVNSLIISGGAGLGKSHTTNKVLHKIGRPYIFHRGYLKATGLFRLLYENRYKGQTVVIDDCDSIFNDEIALNILKGALELKDTRTIGWGSEKEFIDDSGEIIPRYFEYSGSVIFLTNLPFSDLTNNNSKFSVHLSALESRSLVLDLKIKTKREYMIKIKQTLEAGMLRDKGIDINGESDILEFMESNIDTLKELSLRMAEKIASLYLLNRIEWQKIAKTVCCK